MSEASITVVEALTPVLAMMGRCYALDPLTLYPIYLREDALLKLADGQYEISGTTIDANAATTADGQVFLSVNERLAGIDRDALRRACVELMPYADELAITRGLSLSRGIDLKAALHVGRMTYIRPSSAWTRHIVLKTCIESLSEGGSENVVIHVTCLDSPHLAQLELLRAMASKAKAIASFAVLDQNHEAGASHLTKRCALRFQGANVEIGTPHFVVSTLDRCKFGLEYTPMAMWPEPNVKTLVPPSVTPQEAKAIAEADAPPIKSPRLENHDGSSRAA